MTARFWMCVYNDPREGLRGVAGEGSSEAANDVPMLLGTEDLIAQVLNPDLGPGLWIIAGGVDVLQRMRLEPELDYRADENSPAPSWRRPDAGELEAIVNGETPRAMGRWLAGEAWAE